MSNQEAYDQLCSAVQNMMVASLEYVINDGKTINDDIYTASEKYRLARIAYVHALKELARRLDVQYRD